MFKFFNSPFKRPVSKQEKMPHFTDKPSPFSKIIKTLQEYLDDLNYEINKYECPKCGAGLVYDEDPHSSGAGRESSVDGVKGAKKSSGDVYSRSHSPVNHKDSKPTAKEKKGRKGERETKGDPSSEDYNKLLEDEKEKCKALQEVNTNYALQITELEKTLSERVLDVENLNSQLQDEKKTMAEIIEEKENLIREVNEKLRETEEKKTWLQKEMESLMDIEKRHRTDTENYKKTIKENETLIGNLTTKDSKQERSIEELRRKLEGMNETLEKRQRDNANEVDSLKCSHKSSLEVKDKELRTLKGMNETLEKTQKENADEIDRLKRRHMSALEVKDKELRTLKERCTELERHIEKISRKEIAVGFSTTLAPSMSTLLLDGLMTQLTQRLTVEGVDLVRRPFYGNTDFNCPLLAICVNVSRIGADAKEALKGVVKVGNQKDVVLLVFHHKEAHALPSQSSDRLLTGAEFSNLGTIIDLAFLSQRGIYECDMNMMGIERIVSFLLQYKSQKQ
ncbi:myosin-6-like isoform X1 [Ostrea edulis]|uniref:myosin-6-like isoform X1 n=1 Tax=Ostrea edulis TaxID=37623 RepID=UPI0024AEDD58|nr:myosin-6-like isoform X1 [Ostrea edulis]